MYFIGLVITWLGQQRQAEPLASQALNLKPSWFHAYYARCRARVELGRLQEAYQDIVEAARLEPQNRVIKRYAARLSEEGVRLGLKLGMISDKHEWSPIATPPSVRFF